jgi:succinate dehydrogenase flavin-adding protein (antitoxin of CptAB toxin-antitoxin module)
MKTLLDKVDYIFWFPESATLKDGVFRLVLLQAALPEMLEEQPSKLKRLFKKGRKAGARELCEKRVVVEFDNVLFMQAFNEFARNLDDDDSREPHILARHSDSALVRWLKEYTVLFVTDANEEDVRHYSVLTADDIYHVVTDKEPTVYEEEI